MHKIFQNYLLNWQIWLAFLLFLLPWQTRLILHQTIWNGGVWEYGTIGIYATEILLWIVIFFYTLGKTKEWRKIIFLSIVKFLTGNKISPRYHFLMLFGIFILWIFFHLFTDSYPWVEIVAIIHLLEVFTLFFLLTQVGKGKQVIQWSFLAGLGVQAVLALGQFFTQQSFAARMLGLVEHSAYLGGTSVIETINGRYLRAYGGLPHPNVLGGYMAIGALILVIIIFKTTYEKNIRAALKIIGMLLLLVLFVSALVVSFSRSAVIAFTVGLFFISWQYIRQMKVDGFRMQDIWWRVAVVGLSCFFTFSASYIFIPDILTTRVQAETRLEQKSISERIDSYKSASMVWKHTWMWGTGIGNYTGKLHELDGSRLVWDYQPVHNAFILVISELGVVMSLIIAWFLLVARNTPRSWRGVGGLFKVFVGGANSTSKKPALIPCALGAGSGLFFSGVHKTLRAWRENIWNNFGYNGGILVALIIIALFDHYLWSLWSGLLLFITLTFDLKYAKILTYV